jgi:hypothetical protein
MQESFTFPGGVFMLYAAGSYPVMANSRTAGQVKVTPDGLKLIFDCTCNIGSADVLRLAAVCGGAYVPLGVMIPSDGALRMKKSFTKNALAAMGYQDTTLFCLIKPGEVWSEPQAAELNPALFMDESHAGPEPQYPENTAEESQPLPAPEPADNRPEPDVIHIEQAAPPPQLPEPIVYNDFPDPKEYNFDYNDTDIDGWTAMPAPGLLFNSPSIQEACEGISNALVAEQDGLLFLAVPIIPNEPFPMMPVFCFGSSGKVGRQDCIIFKIRDGNLTL